jgi:hypothetical protein
MERRGLRVQGTSSSDDDSSLEDADFVFDFEAKHAEAPNEHQTPYAPRNVDSKKRVLVQDTWNEEEDQELLEFLATKQFTVVTLAEEDILEQGCPLQRACTSAQASLLYRSHPIRCTVCGHYPCAEVCIPHHPKHACMNRMLIDPKKIPDTYPTCFGGKSTDLALTMCFREW